MLKIETLPEDTQEELKRITSTDPKDLTKEEAGFLRARKDYLRPEQVQIFSAILGVKKKVEGSDPFEKEKE